VVFASILALLALAGNDLLNASAKMRYAPLMAKKPTRYKVLYLRDTPPDVARKLKAAAALHGESLTEYVQAVLAKHVADLEKKGQLPKGKV